MALVSALAEGSDRRIATRGIPMRCWDARRHVSDYMNGDLDPAVVPGTDGENLGVPQRLVLIQGGFRGGGITVSQVTLVKA